MLSDACTMLTSHVAPLSGEEGQAGRNRPQARGSAQAPRGDGQSQEGQERFHDTGEEEETEGE